MKGRASIATMGEASATLRLTLTAWRARRPGMGGDVRNNLQHEVIDDGLLCKGSLGRE